MVTDPYGYGAVDSASFDEGYENGDGASRRRQRAQSGVAGGFSARRENPAAAPQQQPLRDVASAFSRRRENPPESAFAGYEVDDDRVRLARDLGREDGDLFSWSVQNGFGRFSSDGGRMEQLTASGRRQAVDRLLEEARSRGYIRNGEDATQARDALHEMLAEQQNAWLSRYSTEDTERDAAERTARTAPRSGGRGTAPAVGGEFAPTDREGQPLTVGRALADIEYDPATYRDPEGRGSRQSTLLRHLRTAGLTDRDLISVEQALLRDPDADLRTVFADLGSKPPEGPPGAAAAAAADRRAGTAVPPAATSAAPQAPAGGFLSSLDALATRPLSEVPADVQRGADLTGIEPYVPGQPRGTRPGAGADQSVGDLEFGPQEMGGGRPAPAAAADPLAAPSRLDDPSVSLAEIEFGYTGLEEMVLEQEPDRPGSAADDLAAGVLSARIGLEGYRQGIELGDIQRLGDVLQSMNAGEVPEDLRPGLGRAGIPESMVPQWIERNRPAVEEAYRESMQGLVESIGRMAGLEEDLQAIPMDPAAAEMFQADSFREGLAAFASAPLEVSRTLALRSLPASSPIIVAAIAGSALGPVGAAAGAGAASYQVERAASIAQYTSEALTERGVNARDGDAVRAFFEQHPTVGQGILHDAMIRAGIIALGDAAAGGLSAGVAGMIRGTGAGAGTVRAVAAGGAGLVTDSATSGGAEALAGLAVEGEVSPSDVLGEAIGGAAMGVATGVGQAAVQGARNAGREPPAPRDDTDLEQPSPPPEPPSPPLVLTPEQRVEATVEPMPDPASPAPVEPPMTPERAESTLTEVDRVEDAAVAAGTTLAESTVGMDTLREDAAETLRQTERATQASLEEAAVAFQAAQAAVNEAVGLDQRASGTNRRASSRQVDAARGSVVRAQQDLNAARIDLDRARTVVRNAPEDAGTEATIRSLESLVVEREAAVATAQAAEDNLLANGVMSGLVPVGRQQRTQEARYGKTPPSFGDVTDIFMGLPITLLNQARAGARGFFSRALDKASDVLRERASTGPVPTTAARMILEVEQQGRVVTGDLQAIRNIRQNPTLAREALLTRMIKDPQLRARTRDAAASPINWDRLLTDTAAGRLSPNLDYYLEGANSVATLKQQDQARAQLMRARAFVHSMTRAEQRLETAAARLREAYTAARQASAGETILGRAVAAQQQAEVQAAAIEENRLTPATTALARINARRQEINTLGVQMEEAGTLTEAAETEQVRELAVLAVAEMSLEGDIDVQAASRMLEQDFGIEDPADVTEIIDEGAEVGFDLGQRGGTIEEIHDIADAIARDVVPRARLGRLGVALGDTSIRVDPSIVNADVRIEDTDPAVLRPRALGVAGAVRHSGDPMLAPAAEAVRRILSAVGAGFETLIVTTQSLDPATRTPATLARDLSLSEQDALDLHDALSLYDDQFQGNDAGWLQPLVRFGRNTRMIAINGQLSPAESAAVAAHEIAHALQEDLIAGVAQRSPHTMTMLNRAYVSDSQNLSPREAAGRQWPSIYGTPETVDQAYDAYVRSFAEWFASQVGQSLLSGVSVNHGGLASRLISRVSEIWQRAWSLITGRPSTGLAASAFVREAMQSARRGMALPVMLRDDFFAQAGRETLASPAASRDELMRNQGAVGLTRAPGTINPDDIDFWEGVAPEAPFLQTDVHDDIPFLRRLSMADQNQVLSAVALVAGPHRVNVRFASVLRSGPNAGKIAERFQLAGRRAGYIPPRRHGGPGTIVLDSDRVRSVNDGIALAQQVLVAEVGLGRMLGHSQMQELLENLGSPVRNNRPRVRSGYRAMTKLREDAVVSLKAAHLAAQTNPHSTITPDSVSLSPINVGREMLIRLAHDVRANGKADAIPALAQLMLGNSSTPSRQLTIDLLTAARDFKINPEVAQVAARERAAILRDKSLYLQVGDWVASTRRYARNIGQRSGTDRSAFGWRAFNETIPQRILRIAGSSTTPFKALTRYAEQHGHTGLARAATNVIDRLEQLISHRDRFGNTQAHYSEALRDATRKAIIDLGGDASQAQASVHAYMSARHAMERNEVQALVYGDLSDDAPLQAQRDALVTRARTAMEARQQGGPLNRDEDIRDIGRQLRDDLRALLLAPGSTNRVAIYLENSRQTKELSTLGRWADFSGMTQMHAIEIMGSIEQQYGTRMASILKSSGLDAATQDLTFRTFQNRVASGITGRQGQVLTSLLHYDHYVPLRGSDTGEAIYEGPLLTGKPLPLNHVTLADRFAAAGGPQQARGPLAGRSAAPDAAHLMDRVERDWMISGDENATNYLNRAIAALGVEMVNAGVVGGPKPEQRAIIVSDDAMPLVVDDGKGHLVRNPELEVSGNQVLAFDDNGNAVKVTVRDDTMWAAIQGRYDPPTERPGMRVLAAYTRFKSRLVTTFTPQFTYVAGYLRDLNETMWIAAGELGLGAKATARIARDSAAHLARRKNGMHAFFWADPAGREAILATARRDPAHPLHNFEKRYRSGGVSTYRDLLMDTSQGRTASALVEVARDPLAAADSVDPALMPNLRQRIQNGAGSVTSVFDVTADAAEQSVRQPLWDEVYARNKKDGMSEADAVRDANDKVRNVMNFDNRSTMGQLMQVAYPFAQVSLTGTYLFLSRRMWNGGQAPVVTERGSNGQVVSRLDWSQVPARLNKKTFAVGAALGFMKTMLTIEATQVAAGMVHAMGATLFGWDEPPDEDLLNAQHSAEIEQLVQGFLNNPRARSLNALPPAMRQQVIRLAAAYQHQLEAPVNLRDPYSLMTHTLFGTDGESRDLRLPTGYGMPMVSQAVGVAAALVSIGEDPTRVRTALGRVLERNFLPTDAPFGSDQQEGGVVVRLLPELAKDLITYTTGEDVDGSQVRTDLGFGGRAAPQGAAARDRFSDNIFLEGLLGAVQEGTEDLTGMRPDLMTNTRFVENLMRDFGGGVGRLMLDSADIGEEYVNGTREGWSGMPGAIARVAGFTDSSAQNHPYSTFYGAVRDPRFSDLETWSRQRGASADFQGRLSGPLAQYRSIIGNVNQAEGEYRDAREAMRTSGDWTDYQRLNAARRMEFEAAGAALEYILETTDWSLPR